MNPWSFFFIGYVFSQPLFSFLEIKKKLKQAGNNWWLLKYKNEADKNAGVKEIGYVEEN